MDLKKIFAEMDRFTPSSGFNVVGVDDFEEPGESLFLIGNYPTLEEAEKVAAERGAKTGGIYHVYASEKKT